MLLGFATVNADEAANECKTNADCSKDGVN